MYLNLPLKRVFSQPIRKYNKIYSVFTPRSNYSTYQQNRSNQGRPNIIINFVPQQEAWVVERLGKFHSVLEPGLNILLPFVDKIHYVHSLKEVAVSISEQSAITNDNVTLVIDGVLFYQVIDPYKASYSIENHEYAIKQLAQTSMRSEIGKLVLDDVFKERDTLNKKIVDSIRTASVKWGIECMRYEIRDVQPPVKVLEAMQMQVEAERKKRAAILESEGLREAAINKASGEAQALRINADSRSMAIKTVAEAMSSNNASNAVCYTVAEQYIAAFSNLAKATNTIILPKNIGDIPTAVAEAMAIFRNMSTDLHTQGGSFNPSSSSSSDGPSLVESKTKVTDNSPSKFKQHMKLTEKTEGDEFRLKNSPTYLR